MISTFPDGQVSPTAGVIGLTATSQREQFGLKLLFSYALSPQQAEWFDSQDQSSGNVAYEACNRP